MDITTVLKTVNRKVLWVRIPLSPFYFFGDIMKNKILNFDIIKSIRKLWPIKPVTKIVPSKKIYNRKKKVKEDE